MSRRTLGADGARAGWVTVVLTDGAVSDVAVVENLAGRLDDVAPDAVGIDMPIGLVDAPRRDAEDAARAFLPGRGSTVFGVPCRTVVEAYRRGELADHAAASALHREVTGSGLSIQSWGLVPRIVEVDDLVRGGRDGLLEVHPETAFRAVVGAPLARKTSWEGMSRRREVLADLGVVLPAAFDGSDRVSPDDVVDAAIAAWVADGWPDATSTLPAEVSQHDGDRPVAMTVRHPGGRERDRSEVRGRA